MKKIIATSIVAVMLLLLSCNTYRKEGDWDDNIFLSKKTAIFQVNGDSVVITTGGTGWWINCISIDDKILPIKNEIQNQSTTNYFKLQTDSCSIVRKDQKTLFIRLNKNNYKRERKLEISLQAGDYYDGITVTQKSQ